MQDLKFSRLITGATAALGLVLLVPSTASADRFDGVRQTIRQHMLDRTVPGVAVAVWKDGKILLEEGFGWADMENRVPANQHTMFALASLSKPLTSVGVMTLVQAGKIDLDRPVNDYLGADQMKIWIGDPRAVTVRRLANHTSGVAAGNQFLYGEDVRYLSPMSENIRNYAVVVSPAGERHSYSNIGYGVLGHLIAQVSGKSYEQYMRQDVFLPLGMTHSSVYLAPELQRYQAIRYDFDRKPIPDYVSAEPASAMVFSSAHDLARFGLFFLGQRQSDQREILNAASREAMAREPIHTKSIPTRLAAKGEDGYALGWGVYDDGGYRAIGHAGAMSGVSTNFILVPEENAGAVVLTNTEGGASNLHLALLKSVLPKWRESAPSAAPANTAKPAFQPPTKLVGRWEGRVHTPEGEQPIELNVLPTGDVHVRIGGNPRYRNRSSLRQPALLNDVKFENGELTGNTLAQIQTSDTRRHPHSVSLRLTLRGDVLNGVAMAAEVYEGLWGYGLPYWTELRAVADPKLSEAVAR